MWTFRSNKLKFEESKQSKEKKEKELFTAIVDSFRSSFNKSTQLFIDYNSNGVFTDTNEVIFNNYVLNFNIINFNNFWSISIIFRNFLIFTFMRN